MKYQFIEGCAKRLPVAGLCRYLGVARSGYYQWRKQVSTQRSKEDLELGDVIEVEFNTHRKAYGSPRMRAMAQDRLRQLGRRHSRRRIRR
jgi:putative transposase